MKNTHIGDGDAGENGSSEKPRPKWGGGEYCPRCDKQVYIAERKQGAGNVSVLFTFINSEWSDVCDCRQSTKHVLFVNYLLS